MLDVVGALLPRMALLTIETRDPFVVAVRARTLRAGAAVVVVRPAGVPVRVAPATPPRETTLRVDVAGVVARVAVEEVAVVRAATVRFAFEVARVAALVRLLLRGFAREAPARVVAPVFDTVPTAGAVGAMGSAKTARIDNSVEQTKNAPASKKTVPMAFLQRSATLRLFINILPIFRKARKPVVYSDDETIAHYYILMIITFFGHPCKANSGQWLALTVSVPINKKMGRRPIS